MHPHADRIRTQTRKHKRDAYLSQCGLANEEVCVFAAFGRTELGVQESTSVRDGLQGSWAFVRESKPDEELEDGKRHPMKTSLTAASQLLSSVPVATCL